MYGGPSAADSQTERAILERLTALEQNQRKLEEELQAKDRRILELEQRLGESPVTNDPGAASRRRGGGCA